MNTCNEINIDKLPKLMIPSMKLDLTYPINCGIECQTDSYNKMLVIDPLTYYKNGTSVINITDNEFLKIYDKLITQERLHAKNYYVTYNATTIDWSFYSYFKTFLRYIEISKNINVAPLIRTPDSNWYFDNTPVNSMQRLFQYFHYHVANQTPESSTNVRPYVMGETTNLDHFEWVKSHIVSCNLSLTGGYEGRCGESTLHYFKDAYVHSTGAIDMINSYIDSLDLNGVDKELFKTKILSIYEYYHKSIKHNDMAVIQQYLIKKQAIDDILYISTPYGYPIPIDASIYLLYLQKADYSQLKILLKEAYEKPDNEFAFDPVSTRHQMHEFNMHIDDLRGVQGRITGCNEELFTKLGNVIINTSTDSGFELTGKLSYLFTAIVDIIAACKKDNSCLSQIKLDYPVGSDNICSIM
jgi:hypothetical protein